MHYLLKTEPSEYSFDDLQRDKQTTWDGVRNPVALRHLREMPAGAKLVIYHTGEERRAVGTARVLAVDAADAKNPRVKIEAGKALAQPVESQQLILRIAQVFEQIPAGNNCHVVLPCIWPDRWPGGPARKRLVNDIRFRATLFTL